MQPPDKARHSSRMLLEVEDLTKHFERRRGGPVKGMELVRAVDGVSFTLARGETLGVVGESGCGKSTLGRLIVRLLDPTGGRIYFDGTDVTELHSRELRRFRRRIQIVFQDPYATLNPRMSAGDLISEPWRLHPDLCPRTRWSQRTADLLDMVGLRRSDANRFPHEFSGGQRQRIGIARALASEPDLVVCDEPTSALDVSVQGQVLNVLTDLQQRLALSLIFISHDLGVVRHIAHRVAVMYLGKIVELGATDDLYQRPTHPYTQALLSAIPDPRRAGSEQVQARIILKGETPGPANVPSGCRFRTRCWKADERCAREEPRLIDTEGLGHPSACHYAAPRSVVPADGPEQLVSEQSTRSVER